MDITLHTHTKRCYWHHELGAWICPGDTPAADRDEPGPALVDVRDMIVVHTAMLREFRLAPAAVSRVQVGDRPQIRTVDRHLAFLCELLHHHHAGEDELLWPKLSDRVPAATLAALEKVEDQHAAIDAALARVTAAREAWAAAGDARTRDELALELNGLRVLLGEHLDLEERAVLPAASAVLTDAEWHAVGDEAVKAMPKSKLLLAFGMFAYEADPAVLRSMLQTAPRLPRVLLPRIAPRIYARRARQVHGTRTP